MTLAAGTRLGSYEILSPLGAGGMGEVYRARDANLRRDVAVKVLPDALADDAEALARFEREARSVAALSHPNILAIHDFGSDHGVRYAVMELLDGGTLRRRLDERPIPQNEAVDYALQLARGLAAAHAKGVVHRDLKPENVFVTRDGHLKILDFGLAKSVESAATWDQTSGPTASAYTEPGTVMGTAAYMSPEQVRGLVVDARSDLFSFGAVLYELLAGKKAFGRDSTADTMAAILIQEPPELSASGRNVAPALDRIVKHCLEKSAERRFQSAKDVVFALGEVAGGDGARAARVSRSISTKNGVVAVIAGVILVLAVAVLLLSRRSRPSAAGPKRIAVLPFENQGAGADDYFADGMADEVRGKLTTLAGLEVIARGSSTPYKKTEKSPAQIAQELGVRYLLTATLRWEKSAGVSRVHVSPELVEVTTSGAPALRWQQPFDAEMNGVFQVQSDIAARVAEALGLALAAGEEKRLVEPPTRNLAAYDAFLKGEAASDSGAVQDAPSLRRALASYEQAVALEPGFAQAWAQLARASVFLCGVGSYSPALAARARQAAERAVALSPDRPEGYLALGEYERAIAGDPVRALEQFDQGQRRRPGDAGLLTARAFAEEAIGQWAVALDHLQQSARLDPRSVRTLRRLGRVLLWLRRYPEAHETLNRALRLAPTNVALIEAKATVFLAEGDKASAQAVLRAVPKGVEPTALVAFAADVVCVFDDEQRDLLLRLTPGAFDGNEVAWGLSLAQASALKGDAANARVYAETARAALEEQMRMEPESVRPHVELGLALAYLGRKDEAMREGERGVALLPVSKDAFFGAHRQSDLVRIYLLVGEKEKALDRLEPLLKMPFYFSPGWLRIDPTFDPLRGNPRFQRLIADTR